MWVLKESENGLNRYQPQTQHYRPHPQPLSKGRGEWYALCIDRLLLVNLSTR